MGQRRCYARWGMVLLLAAPLLEGCASGGLPAPTAQTSPLNGRFSTGTVVSIRQISPADQDGAVTQVLNALGQATAPDPEGEVELVIRRSDNSVTAIVQPQKPGQPSFVPGEKVAIVEAAATVVRPE